MPTVFLAAVWEVLALAGRGRVGDGSDQLPRPPYPAWGWSEPPLKHAHIFTMAAKFWRLLFVLGLVGAGGSNEPAAHEPDRPQPIARGATDVPPASGAAPDGPSPPEEVTCVTCNAAVSREAAWCNAWWRRADVHWNTNIQHATSACDGCPVMGDGLP